VDALESQGVDVLYWIPNNAVMVYVPPTKASIEPEGIAWVGKMNPSDKISPNVGESLSKGYALVDVFPNVAPGEAAAAIQQSGGTIVPNPHLLPGTYLVQADSNVVFLLSNRD